MSQKCYNPDGTDRNLGLETPVYLPCTGNGAVGPNFHCCAFPSSEAGHHDTCLSNGLCSDGGGQIWRESCTDPTWQDAACKHVCNKGIDWNGASMAGNDEKLTQCGDGNWCCGDVNQVSISKLVKCHLADSIALLDQLMLCQPSRCFSQQRLCNSSSQCQSCKHGDNFRYFYSGPRRNSSNDHTVGSPSCGQ